MGDRAFEVHEQIQQLKNRGLKITDDSKAEEYLLDIGYYRLGYYWYYFQDKKNHNFKYNISIDDIVKFYYFDFDIKNILSQYIHRIEVHFRTQIIYYVSNNYKDNPLWYVDQGIVDASMLGGFKSIYNSIKNNESDKRNIIKKTKEYVPAWKIFEFLTFGQIFKFYKNLKEESLKEKIASIYGFKNYEMLESYFSAIINIRNICFHNGVLYDYNQPQPIKKIPDKKYRTKNKNDRNSTNLNVSIRLIIFVLSKVSVSRADDLYNQLEALFKGLNICDDIKQVINDKINFVKI